jgi:PAS domain-containing protein
MNGQSFPATDGSNALQLDHQNFSQVSALPSSDSQAQASSQANVSPGASPGSSPKAYEEQAPKDLVKKLKWMVEVKLLPKLFALNKQYEWRHMLMALFGMFVVVSVLFSIPSIVDTNRSILLSEVTKRGASYAKLLAKEARPSLESGEFAQINTNFVQQAEGVDSLEIVDLDGKVYAPVEKQGQWSQDPFTQKARKYIKARMNEGLDVKGDGSWTGDNQIGLFYPIKAYQMERGLNVPIGLVSIRFSPGSLALTDAAVAQGYVETLITSLLIGLVLLFFLYRLTLHPIQELTDQIDEVMKGDRDHIETESKMSELQELKGVVASSLRQVKTLRSQVSGEDFDADNEETPDALVEPFRGIAEQMDQGVIFLDEERKVLFINSVLEDLIHIRSEIALQEPLIEVCHDDSLSAALLDLCDQSDQSPSSQASQDIPIGGDEYDIHVNAVRTKKGKSKAFIALFAVQGDEV